ncbi:MAG: hypothetical protein JXA30_16805, partial [Deltaproteobacteria bacterium]|nr:hypothetical protein [Deltaproteobacteria bacterium]
EPARGRKPVLRDELAAVVVKQQYPSERLLFERGSLENSNNYEAFGLGFGPVRSSSPAAMRRNIQTLPR